MMDYTDFMVSHVMNQYFLLSTDYQQMEQSLSSGAGNDEILEMEMDVGMDSW